MVGVQTSLSARGPAAPDEVWDRYARPARWPQWSPQIRRVSTDGGAVLAAGDTGQVYGPLGVSVRFRVDEIDHQARTWSWTVWRGPVRLRLEHSVIAHGAGGSATGLTIEGPAVVVLGYLPLAQLALQQLVRR